MGKTCEPKAFSFQCMTKFTTKKKKKRLATYGRPLRVNLESRMMNLNIFHVMCLKAL